MMSEILLQNRINVLQLEMLKFHNKISPKKSRESERGLPLHNGNSELMSSCIEIAFGLLKICVCVLGPATFPAIIFCIEGSSWLFWQVTVVSCVITLILALVTMTILYASLQKFKQGIGDMFASFCNAFNKLEVFRFIRRVASSDALKKNVHIIIYLLALVLLGTLISFLSFWKNLTTVFYGSLISVGFVSGILSSVLYNIISSSESLPFYSPCRVEMLVTAPSPEVNIAKRNLNFTYPKSREPSPEFRFSLPNEVRSSDENVEFSETRTLTAISPNIQTPAFQEIARTQTLQLPIAFRKLIRKLSL